MAENKPEGCSGSCGDCSKDCSSRAPSKLPQNQFSHVKKVIGVVSGKGGVGKSLVTSLLACAVQTGGYQAAVFDADVTGPSVPKEFGIRQKAAGSELGLEPAESRLGIRIMSVNLLLEQEDAPVVWRGPVISGVINQFWTDVLWGDVDYMFVDMPPGTGDVPLTVFQSIPLDGIVIVTTPQDLVNMIVRKAYHMAQMMNVPVIGLIENMSYVACPDCGRKIALFGESKIDEAAGEMGLPVLAKLPVDPNTAALVDKGGVELAQVPGIAEAAAHILKQVPIEM